MNVVDESESERIMNMVIRGASEVANDFLQLADDSRLKRASKDAAVTSEILHIWAKGWTFFDAVINGMEQSAALMADRGGVEDDYNDVREALLLLQCMATQTLREIRTLLIAGYLSGASARWRALHETAVIAVVIVKGGSTIARRYVDQGIMLQLQRLEEFYKQPHPKAPPLEERSKRMSLASELMTKHTLPNQTIRFDQPYAWATPLMEINSKNGKYQAPTFVKLEEIAQQADMRLLVQHGAHGYVHNDPGAVRTAVLRYGSSLVVGPQADEIQTVAVPTLRTCAVVVAATHAGFEPEFDEYGRIISTAGAALADLSMRGAHEFQGADRSTQLLF